MVTLMLAAVVGLNAAPNVKETAKASEALVAEGKKHFVQREYAKAIEKFEAAYDLDGKTIHLYNIGKCHDRLNQVGMALRHYREYLRLEPKAQQDDVVKQDIATAVRHLGDEGKQQLVIFAEPAEAEIRVDGEARARIRARGSRAPAYVELKDGPHHLVVSANGYQTEERRLETPLPATNLEQTFKLIAAQVSDAPKAPIVAGAIAPGATTGPGAETAKSPAPPRRIGVGT